MVNQIASCWHSQQNKIRKGIALGKQIIRLYLLLAFVAQATNANSQSKYVIITADSLTNPVKVNYAWNWHILPLTDSTFYINTWGFVDTNVQIQNYMYSSLVFNSKNKSINNFVLQYDTNYLLFPALINSTVKTNDNFILSLNENVVYTFDTSIQEFRASSHPQLNKLSITNQNIWSKIYGDSNKYYNCGSIKSITNHYYIACTKSTSISPATDKQFCLFKLDTNGNQIWEKEYPFVPREYAFNIHEINNNLYVSGYRKPPPYWDDRNIDIIKKIDTNGNLLIEKSFPFKLNSQPASFATYADVNDRPLLVSFNAEHPEDLEERSFNCLRQVRMRIIDTNFNILSTIMIAEEENKVNKEGIGLGIRKVRNVGVDKFLVIGAKLTGLNNNQVLPWACLIDTSGKLFWYKTFKIREIVDHYLTDGVPTADGGFLLSGMVGGQVSKGTNQDAILIKIDSLGCLDTTGCWPLGIAPVPARSLLVKVYPNPITNQLTIALPSDKIGKKTLTITDLQGKQIYNFTTWNTTINVQSEAWPNGMYLINLVFNNEQYNYKILKQ